MEGRHTALDDDFITVWSKYMLTLNEDEMMPAITALAEMGQLNAVAKWYLHKNPSEHNPKIDLVADRVNGYGINDTLVLAAREMARNKIKYQGVKIEIDRYRAIMKGERGTLGFVGPKTLKAVSQVQALLNKLEYSDYGRHLHYALALVNFAKQADKNNMLLNQKGLEIRLNEPYLFVKPSRKEIRRVRKGLMVEHVKNPGSAKTKYSLACNYLMNPSSQKQKNTAKDMLAELASRPLSNELRDAMERKEKLS